MACQDYSDLIALAAAGELNAHDRALLDQHIKSCASCCAALADLTEIVTGLNTATDTLSPVERLELENRILRQALDLREQQSARARMTAPLRITLRVAATLVMFWLGYLARPMITSPGPVPASPPIAAQTPNASPAQMRRAMNSGMRFSGIGLRAIAMGHKAVTSDMALTGPR